MHYPRDALLRLIVPDYVNLECVADATETTTPMQYL
jgi:hypothetical protein